MRPGRQRIGFAFAIETQVLEADGDRLRLTVARGLASRLRLKLTSIAMRLDTYPGVARGLASRLRLKHVCLCPALSF